MKFQIRLTSLLFVLLLAGLSVLIVFLAYSVYTGLYGKILTGFDNQLKAAGTINAGNIPGDDHQEIIQFRQLRGIAYDPARRIYYGKRATEPVVIVFNGNGAVIRRFEVSEDLYHGDVTYDKDADRLLFTDLDTGALKALSLNGEVTDLFTDPDGEPVELPYCEGLAYVSENTVYCAADALYRIDLKSGSSRRVASVDFTAMSALYIPESESLLLLNTDESSLHFMDLKSFLITKEVKLSENGKDYRAGVFAVVPAAAGNGYIGASTLSLIRISPDGDLKPVPSVIYGSPRVQNLYKKYVMPLILSRREAGLTFLYTAYLTDKEKYIEYALDGTQSSIHSFTGVPDSDEAADGIRDVILKRRIFLSEITEWEDWGLLKSAYVPVINESGDATAYAGADVNIDVIETMTRTALLQVILIGIITAAAGMFAAYIVSKRVTRPIAMLKQSALRVAAGNFDEPIEVHSPIELKDLGSVLNRLRETLRDTVSSLTDQNIQMEQKRRSKEMISYLTGRVRGSSRVQTIAEDGMLILSAEADGRIYTVFIENQDSVQTARLYHDVQRSLKIITGYSKEDQTDFFESMLADVPVLLEFTAEKKSLNAYINKEAAKAELFHGKRELKLNEKRLPDGSLTVRVQLKKSDARAECEVRL